MWITVDDHRLFTLHFADDQVKLAEDEIDINYMIRKLSEEYCEWGLNMNLSKTEYLVVRGTGADLHVGNGVIRNSSEYKHLGIKVTDQGGTDDEISSKIGQAKMATRQLSSLLWDTKLTNNTKIRLYETTVESLGTYKAELWVINKRNEPRIRAMEINF